MQQAIKKLARYKVLYIIYYKKPAAPEIFCCKLGNILSLTATLSNFLSFGAIVTTPTRNPFAAIVQTSK